jgi:hypothetical protein
MACPKCGCKVSYQYDNGWDGEQTDERLERCASCRHVFDIEDHADEDDEDATCGVNGPAPTSKEAARG